VPTDLKAAYLCHSPELLRFVARRLGDRHSAADVVHDAFVRMAEQPGTTVQDARSYLFRIARNLLVDGRKQEARRKTATASHDMLAHIADDAPAPDEVADARLKLERLQTIVGEMPFKTQQIFVLNRIDGLSYADVASQLGISESSVQKHLAMAVQHIAHRFRSR
jgi:RNA polymerase sigma-70 factor (ECF subfamily)